MSTRPQNKSNPDQGIPCLSVNVAWEPLTWLRPPCFLKMYLNGDHLCIRSTTHAKQRVGLKRHLCGSSWPPRRRPQPDLKFVTKKSNTFQYAHLKNFENIFEFSWFLLNIWKPSFHDINWNLSEFFKPNAIPPKSPFTIQILQKSFSTNWNISQTFLLGLVLTNVKLRQSL